MDLNGIKVLVIDDSPDCLMLFKAILKNKGATPATATGIEDCLNGLAIDPDVILIDWQLGEATAADVLKLIRDKGVKCPAAVISAKAFESDKEQAMKNGFSGYLTKPCNTDEFCSFVKSVVDENLRENSDRS